MNDLEKDSKEMRSLQSIFLSQRFFFKTIQICVGEKMIVKDET